MWVATNRAGRGVPIPARDPWAIAWRPDAVDDDALGPQTGGMDPDVLTAAADAALRYARTVDERRVFPDEAGVAALRAFDEELPERGTDPAETIRLLDEVGGPATVASTGPSYFGFVTGGNQPVALGAAWLA